MSRRNGRMHSPRIFARQGAADHVLTSHGTWSTAGFFTVLGAAGALTTCWCRPGRRAAAGLRRWSRPSATVSAVVFRAGFIAGPIAVTVRPGVRSRPGRPQCAWPTVAFNAGQAAGGRHLTDSEGTIANGLWLSGILPGPAGRRCLGPA